MLSFYQFLAIALSSRATLMGFIAFETLRIPACQPHAAVAQRESRLLPAEGYVGEGHGEVRL